ncbi:Predicted PurR-regulated permease PerM [Noviherbaspirillum humi]|uniref:Predicted PurR-regulated permease PerM n=1 Tax=Noviherbaspirillum humi TaxID=1688639 RepID=A0A239LLI2_9BURK|nr:AI-2E family transporter [Noviherbaspirillum humi]SNT31331.1 Predicted PurR-regulated permease PerM [Noviherbaspirillum humi]
MRELPSLSRLTAGSLVSATCLLALLHFGREVLEPVALAAILSLILAPLIRALERLGWGRLPATLAAVLLAAACVVGMTLVLASQLAAVTRELPQYRAAIRVKVAKVRELTERPFARIQAELSGLVPQPPADVPKPRQGAGLTPAPGQPVPVEIRPPRLTTQDTLARLLALALGPIGEAGLVLLLMVFISLEHESLKDRLVQFAGHARTSRTIKTLADATQGVSRFFFFQFVVNAAFGAAVGLALWLGGIPHAALWGTLSGALRFVPYLGILGAGAATLLFVAAIDPGWALSLYCVGLFLVLELLVANVVEPKVYGHSSGLSPLAVILSALFWSAMWGPVGLLLSTPLTLCLVVMGRHVRALEPLSVFLGEAPNVTAAQRFYQRALSGDTKAIVRDAQLYLRRHGFARYCDQILLPGLGLAVNELSSGDIDASQQARIRVSIIDIAEALTPSSGSLARPRRRPASLIDASVGAHLRQLREARFGRWQGPLDVPAKSVVLCAGLGSQRDDLLSELLVRALRQDEVDARSVVIGTASENPGADKGGLVSTVFITYPTDAALEPWLAAAAELRADLPQALLVTIRLPFEDALAPEELIELHVDMILRSFEEGLAFVHPQPEAPRQ